MKIDQQLQMNHLLGVSRSFALTIPMLPAPLKDYVANAYLLCRIADTVEDDPKAPVNHKIFWLKSFAQFALTNFADELELLSLHRKALAITQGAIISERKLIDDMLAVVECTASFPLKIKQILGKGVSILAFGMAKSLDGFKIEQRQDVDNYCYFVAGVVGELLAALFAEHNHNIDKQALMSLAVSFGEGLQLTNILKDRAVDAERHVSFLPYNKDSKSVEQEYIHLCQGHLDDALDFICKIPSYEAGIRRFCYVNILMATATLKKISNNNQQSSVSIKISRRQLKFLLVLSNLCVKHNWSLRLLFTIISKNIPRLRRSPEELSSRVSWWNKDISAILMKDNN